MLLRLAAHVAVMQLHVLLLRCSVMHPSQALLATAASQMQKRITTDVAAGAALLLRCAPGVACCQLHALHDVAQCLQHTIHQCLALEAAAEL
jgi:hypothetical protein